MLQNYLKITYRNLLKNKSYTFINIAGLAVGIACCMLIAFYVKDELSYDRYHKNGDNIYRLLQTIQYSDKAEDMVSLPPADFQLGTNLPAGPALASDFPEIKTFVRFSQPLGKALFQYGEKSYIENNVVFIDSTVFEVFEWQLLIGNPATALTEPNTMVISEKIAEKYFGKMDPIGQTIIADYDFPFKVTGVMKNIPANSHLKFDILFSMASHYQVRPEIFESWDYPYYYTYLLLHEHADVASLQAKVPDFLKRNNNSDRNLILAFEPMTDAYLHSKAGNQPGVTGKLSNIYIFSSIAIFILIIAGINYMNLATARSVERAKDVGVRKVIGAQKSGIIYQFLIESVLLAILASILAVVIAELTIPALQELTGKSFTKPLLFSTDLLLWAFAVAVLIGILGGAYPAWVLSRFQPGQVLKGQYKTSASGIFLRKGLVVFQFSLSMILIAGTAIIFYQLQHLRSQDLGFKQVQMMVMDLGFDYEVNKKIEVIKEAYKKHPAVVSATASRAVPGDVILHAPGTILSSEGEMKTEKLLIYEVDHDFIPHFEIEMAAGRPFSHDFIADSANALLLNEAAAKLYGYTNAEDVVGRPFSLIGNEGTVVGVVKDFNFQSLHQNVEPLALRIAPHGYFNRLTLQVKPDDLQETIAEAEHIWKQFVVNRPFEYRFLDESFNQQYQAEVRFGQVFSIFSGLGIFIACLGLLGLSAYTIQNRTKEIGIRKVMGASVFSIIALLSKDYLKLIISAAVIAFPAAWYTMQLWLQDFPYRISIPLWIFIFAGLVATIIALITISYHAIRAATSNPVKSLKAD
jgi:putative ABC transport system permease protein